MILIFIAIIFLLKIINNKDNQNKDFKNEIKIFLLCVCFTITIKPFYLIYGPLVLALFIFHIPGSQFRNVLFKDIFDMHFINIIHVFLHFYKFFLCNFPITFTCFENLSWAIDKDHINDVKFGLNYGQKQEQHQT